MLTDPNGPVQTFFDTINKVNWKKTGTIEGLLAASGSYTISYTNLDPNHKIAHIFCESSPVDLLTEKETIDRYYDVFVYLRPPFNTEKSVEDLIEKLDTFVITPTWRITPELGTGLSLRFNVCSYERLQKTLKMAEIRLPREIADNIEAIMNHDERYRAFSAIYKAIETLSAESFADIAGNIEGASLKRKHIAPKEANPASSQDDQYEALLQATSSLSLRQKDVLDFYEWFETNDIYFTLFERCQALSLLSQAERLGQSPCFQENDYYEKYQKALKEWQQNATSNNNNNNNTGTTFDFDRNRKRGPSDQTDSNSNTKSNTNAFSLHD